MQMDDERIRYAVSQTEVLKHPKQSLSTFGTTVVDYFLLTEPVYSEIEDAAREETVVREGKVSSEKPRVVTPYYLTRLEGFGENARKYLETIIDRYGQHAPGVLYSYRNETKGLSIVSDRLDIVAGRLNDKIETEGSNLVAIIKGVDDLWDVSLLKFISELTEGSLRKNMAELGGGGLLQVDKAGIPFEARLHIESLFHRVARGECDPSELKRELDLWDIFSHYEDRFLNLFRTP